MFLETERLILRKLREEGIVRMEGRKVELLRN